MTTARAVTGRQRQLLSFIADHLKAKGTHPTIREIGIRMNIRSTNGVADHIRYLLKKGMLTKCPNKARSIRLTAEAEEVLGLNRSPDAVERAARIALHALEGVLEKKPSANSHVHLAIASLRGAGIR